jgi:15-cis-phytoene synthase
MPATPEPGSTRALASLYCHAPQRPLLAALCGIEREIGTSLLPRLDHQVAHARLAWWREECARCAAGRPGHPLTRELGASLPAAALSALAGLVGLVENAEWDLARATFAARPELSGYCERWSRAMLEPLAHGSAPAAAAAPVRALGASLRELELLLVLPAEARAGRIRLPLDELERVQVSPAALTQPPWPEALAALLRERHRQLRGALGASVAALAPAAQPAMRGLIVWAALTARHSARAARDLPRARPAGEHHAPLDGWRAWRAARRAQRGECRLSAD